MFRNHQTKQNKQQQKNAKGKKQKKNIKFISYFFFISLWNCENYELFKNTNNNIFFMNFLVKMKNCIIFSIQLEIY